MSLGKSAHDNPVVQYSLSRESPTRKLSGTAPVARTGCSPEGAWLRVAYNRDRTMPALSNPSLHRAKVFLAFGLLYVFWGGTYTANRIGVVHVPATVLAGVRLGVAGALILLFSRLLGKRLLAGFAEMRRLFVLGVLLLFAGNVALVWAQFYLPSGLAALLAAIVPVYIALIELALPDGERLRPVGNIGLALGCVGLAILAWPSARAGLRGEPREFMAIAVLLLGALGFSFGAVLSRKSRLTLDLFVCVGWEMIAASICDLSLATVTGAWNSAHWNRESLFALMYLIVCGSIIGFSCFMWLLSNAPITKVATYTYVNPVVAVLLGAAILDERLQGNEWIGMATILVAVFLVTSFKLKPQTREAPVGTEEPIA